MPRYLNPYTDFGFKKLFGEEANKDLLMDFLNQLLPPHHQIAELNFRNTEQLPDIPLERKAIFDINCISVTGERFIVEMQKAKLHFFKDRALFYVTFPIRDQAQKGEWTFKLDPIYFIAILDFEYDEADEQRKFRRDVSLRDQDGEPFFDKLHFKFLQMPLFHKQEHELETRFDKWLYFLKHLESFDHIPAILNEPIFQKAFQIAELANLSREQYSAYEQNLLDYWGVKAALETARDDGRAEGRMEGRIEGHIEGQVAMLRMLLLHRFGPLPAWAESVLARATPAQLEQWGRGVLQAETLTAVFEN
jgi:predicted transposase/invertase (TIGR01784 family)